MHIVRNHVWGRAFFNVRSFILFRVDVDVHRYVDRLLMLIIWGLVYAVLYQVWVLTRQCLLLLSPRLVMLLLEDSLLSSDRVHLFLRVMSKLLLDRASLTLVSRHAE